VLLSSMPRSYTSRLAWLNRTLIAVASGRINQNSKLYTCTHTKYLNLIFEELAVTKQISALPVSTSEPTPVKPGRVGSPSKKIIGNRSSCFSLKHGLITYDSRIFIPCHSLFFSSEPNRKTGLLGPSSRFPYVNFVVLFHAFTGLQCRFRYYLYLVACILLPRNRHQPRGRFSSVCHQKLWIYI
jgi:hypothetical protein